MATESLPSGWNPSYVPIFLSISLASFFLNVLLSYTLLKKSNVVTTSNLLYAYLLISDVAFVTVSLAIQLASLTMNETWKVSFCQANGFVAQFFAGMSVSLVFFQVINPFRIIIFEKQSLTNRQITMWMIIFCTTIFMSTWFPFISGDRFKAMPSRYWCYANFDNPKWGTIVMLSYLLVILIVFPIAFAIGFIWIWLRMKSYSRQRAPKARERLVQWILLRQGMVLLTVLSLVWSYPAVIIAGRVFGAWTISSDQDLAILGISFVSPILNPIVMLCLNEKIRSAAYKILTSMLMMCSCQYETGDNFQADHQENIDSSVDEDTDIPTKAIPQAPANQQKENILPLPRPVFTGAILAGETSAGDSTTEIMGQTFARRC